MIGLLWGLNDYYMEETPQREIFPPFFRHLCDCICDLIWRRWPTSQGPLWVRDWTKWPSGFPPSTPHLWFHVEMSHWNIIFHHQIKPKWNVRNPLTSQCSLRLLQSQHSISEVLSHTPGAASSGSCCPSAKYRSFYYTARCSRHLQESRPLVW